MKNILVSGASGIIGYGILRSLKKSQKDLKLIGTTIYPDSPAQGFSDVFELALPTADDRYLGWLLDTITKHQIDLIIPGIEADMYKWVEHISDIEKSGAKILLNNPALISLCKDKWMFYEALKAQNSTYAIETLLVQDFDILTKIFGLPFLLKPRCGHGSKGIVKIETREVFTKYQSAIGGVLLAQPIVGSIDEEFTTSAFCDGKGSFYTAMTLRRKLSKDGFTEKAEVETIPGINEAVAALCSMFNPLGPTNFQFRRHNGELKLLEINPRISSSTSIRAAFGYNESLMAVEYFLEGKVPVQPQLRKGKAIRYTEDLIIYDENRNTV